MGCKGKKRREKNYRNAHGDFNRLPPPPDHSKLDALPSKLRQIMSFTSPSNSTQESVKGLKNETGKRKRKDGANGEKRSRSEDDVKGGDENKQKIKLQNTDSGNESLQSGKSKKKRKRKPVEDLRFEADSENTGNRSNKKERKKKLLEERKNKHKKNKTEENLDFPGLEKIKFGDVVEAPPKLVTFPKVPKSLQDASRERLRLQAVEAYRNRNGWTSRPGIKLPPPVTTTLL